MFAACPNEDMYGGPRTERWFPRMLLGNDTSDEKRPFSSVGDVGFVFASLWTGRFLCLCLYEYMYCSNNGIRMCV